jgi:putative DNA methylase
LDVDAREQPALVDALHSLMLVYEEDGARAAQEWLNRRGLLDDERFAALVRAALHAVPRRTRKGEFVRPEARVLDSLRTSFFDHLPLPPDPDAVDADPESALF